MLIFCNVLGGNLSNFLSKLSTTRLDSEIYNLGNMQYVLFAMLYWIIDLAAGQSAALGVRCLRSRKPA
jgi:hypothetical protein